MKQPDEPETSGTFSPAAILPGLPDKVETSWRAIKDEWLKRQLVNALKARAR